MSTRRTTVVLLALALLVVVAPGRAAAADIGWMITDFDVAVTVQQDGSLLVTERIDVNFGGLERRGIFREIPVRYAVGPDDPFVDIPPDREASEFYRALDISDVEVTSTAPDDVEVTSEGTNTRIRIGDEDITVTGAQSYEISYRVEGALDAYDTHTELVWDVTGTDWPVPIQQARATIGGAPIELTGCVQGRPGATDPCDEPPDESDDAVTAGTDELRPGETFTMTVGFAPDAIDVPPPIVREWWTLSRALTGSAAAWPLTVLTALLGFGGVGLLAYRQGRDRVTRGTASIDGHVDDEPARLPLRAGRETPVQFRPPDDLRPAQLGLIVDERVDPVEISATLVDLAVRGHLTIEEVETSRAIFFSKTDWRLHRVEPAPDDELLPYEKRLLDALFADGSSVDMSDLRGKFASDYERVVDAIYADGVRRKWFSSSPKKTRSRWLGIGIVAILASVGLLIATLTFTTVALAAVPLVLAAIILAIAHRWMPHRTPKGGQLLAETLGFKEFISTAEAGRMDFAEREKLFVDYLPYAVVFGVVDQWAGAFADLGEAATAAVGGWYLWSHSGPRDLSRLSSGLSDFSHTVGDGLSHAPSSSGSGGGGSGGGFGGGGGGSW